MHNNGCWCLLPISLCSTAAAYATIEEIIITLSLSPSFVRVNFENTAQHTTKLQSNISLINFYWLLLYRRVLHCCDLLAWKLPLVIFIDNHLLIKKGAKEWINMKSNMHHSHSHSHHSRPVRVFISPYTFKSCGKTTHTMQLLGGAAVSVESVSVHWQMPVIIYEKYEIEWKSDRRK